MQHPQYLGEYCHATGVIEHADSYAGEHSHSKQVIVKLRGIPDIAVLKIHAGEKPLRDSHHLLCVIEAGIILAQFQHWFNGSPGQQ